MVDGVDNNQAFFSEARGRTRAVYSISSASIKEFQVGVSNMSAEFGRAAGGTVNAVTKSGTNAMSGEGFYFLRDKAFQARDPFIAEPFWDEIDERRQQFGAALGGPIVRDRVFFFGSYDQQVRDFPPYVNTAAANFYDTCTAPAGNCDATRAYFRSLQDVPMAREANNKVGLAKVDWNINTANTLSMSYNGQRWRSPHGIQTQAVITVAESANGTDIVTTDFGVINWNSIVSSRFLNEMRIQIGRDNEQQTPNGVGPGTSVTGGIGFGMPNFLPRPKYPYETRYQVLDSVTYFRGQHTLKGGLDLNFVREELQNLFQGGGVYQYTGLTTIAQDCPAGVAGCVPRGRRQRGQTLRQLQPGVRPERNWRSPRVSKLHLCVLRAGHVEAVEPPRAEPRPALRVPAAAAAGRNLDRGRDVQRQPAFSADDELPPGQEQLGAARRPHLRFRRRPPDRAARRVRPVLRLDEQQRGGERDHQQRRQPGGVLLHADDSRARRCIRTCCRRCRRSRAAVPT